VSALHLEKRDDGVAMITLDTPDSKVNVISRELFDEIAAALDSIEKDDRVRACVLTSAKPGSFIAGADLKQLIAVETAAEGEAFSRNGQALLDRMARSRKPFVAAIHGAALGGGLEVALACHYILASDDPKTVLGLPEVMLGLLPGGGGTQRLPRRIGLPEALPLMLTGRRLRAKRAYRMGLVDALTSPGGIAETAAQAALQLAEGKRRRRKVKRPLINRLLESAALRPLVFRKAVDGVRRQTRGNYPAPPFIIDCARTGFARGQQAGLARESVLFGRLTAGPEAKNLIGLFEAMNELKKPLGGAEPRPVRRLGVLGGGFMGAGIAAVSTALARVVVKDISDQVLTSCAKSVKQGLDRRVRSRAISRFERDRQLAKLQLTTEASALRGVDLVVEAVFEDLELKRKVLAETEQAIGPETVFASNTSALPIASIAETARHPERILGMHYFSPVPKMPLLELVVTDKTAEWAVATARALGIAQGKTVIVVKDGPGFYTSRILSPYLAEAVILIQEGAGVEDVDRALKDFGYPVGPVALLDEIGIDVAAHVAQNFGTLYADRGLGGTDAFGRLHEAGYAGRKNRRGFYRYEGDEKKRKKKKKKQANEEVYAVVGAAPRKAIPAEQIADRLSLLMVNEAAYCLDEAVIESPRDGDVGAILGLGFPPFRGGPFRYLDALGLPAAIERMERLREAHGPRFEPAPLLRRMAAEGQSFY
jgi:3-hydroxyacyl-CoA dehydrogenase/enoyl-CoA hydratase/3-hydroxybutyryl-CoA epimerase